MSLLGGKKNNECLPSWHPNLQNKIFGRQLVGNKKKECFYLYLKA